MRTGRRSVGRGGEEALDGRGDGVGRALGQNATRFRRGHDFRDPADARGNNRRSARHRFEQHVRPTFARGRKHQDVGNTVQRGELAMGTLAKEPNAVSHSKPLRKRLELGPLGPIADND
jgi:hypothetical protein